MKILKIKGKDETIIREQIKKEYGDEAVIISTQQERVEGIKGIFKKPLYSITIAVDENVPKPQQEDATKGMFSYLKDQIELIRKEVAHVKELATVEQQQVSPPLAKIPEVHVTNIKQILYSSLKQEDIHDEVIEQILSGIDENHGIEENARILYANLSGCLRVEEHTETPQMVFFVGSTGVGKTTTIAKLTAEYSLNQQKKLALFTADTYRIAAIEQLKTYAEILDVPLEVIYSEADLDEQMNKWSEMDHLFVDTAGRSHKNSEQMEDMKSLLISISKKKVFLVLNVNTSYRDAKNIIDLYKTIAPEMSLIITKLDETDEIGNLVNIGAYAKCPIAYITTGQNVPDDIEKFDNDKYVKSLLGRISYE